MRGWSRTPAAEGGPCIECGVPRVSRSAHPEVAPCRCAMQPGGCTRWTTTTWCAHQTCTGTGTGSARSCFRIPSICTGAGDRLPGPTDARDLYGRWQQLPVCGLVVDVQQSTVVLWDVAGRGVLADVHEQLLARGRHDVCLVGQPRPARWGATGAGRTGRRWRARARIRPALVARDRRRALATRAPYAPRWRGACAGQRHGRQLRSGWLQLPVRDVVVGVHREHALLQWRGRLRRFVRRSDR